MVETNGANDLRFLKATASGAGSLSRKIALTSAIKASGVGLAASANSISVWFVGTVKGVLRKLRGGPRAVERRGQNASQTDLPCTLTGDCVGDSCPVWLDCLRHNGKLDEK